MYFIVMSSYLYYQKSMLSAYAQHKKTTAY